MREKFFVAMIYCLLCHPSFAQLGAPDLSFKATGYAFAKFTQNDFGYAMAVQPDGKILVAGSSTGSSGETPALVRFNSNGTLDNTFSGDGYLSFSFSATGYGSIVKIVLQPDGKIILGGTWMSGSQNADFAFARLNTDGSFDNSFDGDGKLVLNIDPVVTSNDVFNCLALQSDGKILAGGSTTITVPGSMVLVRLMSNGSKDNSFDSDGILKVDFDGTDGSASSIAISNDGKILVAGNVLSTFGLEMALFRCNSAGVLDNTFDSDGKTRAIFSTFQTKVNDMAIQSDGKIVLAMRVIKSGSETDFGVARFLVTGRPDSSFSNDGMIDIDFITQSGVVENGEDAFAIAVQSDGKIVTVGEVRFSNPPFSHIDIGVVRLLGNGQPDTGFDGDGKKQVDLGVNESTLDMWLINNRIYVAGYQGPTNCSFLLVALQNNGSPLITAIPRVNDQASIRVYPNPVSQTLFLETKANREGTVRIYNTAGVLVAERKIATGGLSAIPVSNLQAGMYFIELKTTDGIQVERFVVTF